MSQASITSLFLDRFGYTLVAFAGVAMTLSIAWVSERQHEVTLERYRAESSAATHHSASAIEARLALLYQGLRTIARLPGVRGIDRFGKNFDVDAKRSTQEIYNNLALNVSVSEVYIVPSDFDPDAIDAATGKTQEPIIQFDHLIEGRTASSPARLLPATETADAPAIEVEENSSEIEIFEYREMREQYRKLAAQFNDEAKIEHLAYPLIASAEVITCDNSRFSPEHPDDKRRSGLVVSVPFYGSNGRIKGMVSAVLLSDVIGEMLVGGDRALIIPGYDYKGLAAAFKPSSTQSDALRSGVADNSLLYSEVVALKTADAFSPWKLWASRSDAAYWAREDVQASGTISMLAYICAAALTALLFGAVYLCRNFARATRARQEDLEAKVSERTRELELARAAAEAANETKLAFIANLSLELRTPLNSIMGFSDILSQEHYGKLGDRRYKDHAVNIWAAGGHLLALVNDILELSRIESGKTRQHDEVVHVSEVVHDALHRVAPLARSANVELAVNIPDGRVRLNVDPHRLAQLLANLLTNAIRFAPEQSTVTLAFQAEGLEPAFVVSNTGAVMTQEQITLALTPFGQIDSENSRRLIGSVLGLPLAKLIAEALGGGLSVESSQNAGTKISVRLPAWRLIERDAVRCVA